MIGTNDFFSCHINFSISTIWTLFTDYLHFVEKRKLIFWLHFAHFSHWLCTARCMWSVRCKENSGFYQLNASLTVHSTIKTVWILHQFDSLKSIRLKAVVTSIQKCGSSIAHRWTEQSECSFRLEQFSFLHVVSPHEIHLNIECSLPFSEVK